MKKYKGAICDNDLEDLKRLQEAIETYRDSHREIELELTACQQPLQLKAAIDGGTAFDFYILDVMMPEIDGIDLGRVIRENDDNVPIIYATSSREYAFDAFEVHAMAYLEKPVKAANLETLMDNMLRWINLNRVQEEVIVNGKDGMINIVLDDIVYVENMLRSAVYTLKDGNRIMGVCNRSTFEESVGCIGKSPRFVHPHKSYFINMDYIQKLNSDKIMMENGTLLPISRKNSAAVKKTYLRYLAGGK